MRRYEAAIFDVDGTLLDTTSGISASVLRTIEDLGLPPLEGNRIESFIGPPIQGSFIREYGMDAVEAQAAADIFRGHYKRKYLFEAQPYPGIEKTLERIRGSGIRIGIATYKRADYARDIIDHFGFSGLCESVNGADNENMLSKKDIIGLTMSEMGLKNAARTIYIGDTVSDAKSAEALEMDFLAVTYGFGFKSKEDVNGTKHAGVACDPDGIMAFFIEGKA